MTMQSMTGFASCHDEDETARWVWELKSVNGRGLELRFRLPPNYEAVEAQARPIATEAFTRGNLQMHLTVRRTQETTGLRVDDAALAMLLAVAEKIRAVTKGPPVSVDALLSAKGVLVADDTTEPDAVVQGRQRAILATFEKAVSELTGARRAEGTKLDAILRAQLAEMSAMNEAIARHPSRTPLAVREKLAAGLARLLDADERLDPDRLHQEAVLLATKADIEEEVQRMQAHLEAAAGLIETGEPVGRRLDFLAQEFNREANTICSKANDADLSARGLALKSVIERFREQVQNVE